MENKDKYSKEDFEGVDHAQDWDVRFEFQDYLRLDGYDHGYKYGRSFVLTVSEVEGDIVAKAFGDLIQFELAAAHGFPFEEVGEWHNTDERCLPRTFFNHLGMDPWPKLDAHYRARPRLNRNMLVVDRLDILPQFRGYGIGGAMLKYMAELLYENCGLMVVQVLPSQHRVHVDFATPDFDWEEALELRKLEPDAEMAKFKLMGLAIKMGFENPFGIDHVFAPMDTMALDWKLDLSRMEVPTDYDDVPEDWNQVFEDEDGNTHLILDNINDTDDDDQDRDDGQNPDDDPEEQPK